MLEGPAYLAALGLGVAGAWRLARTRRWPETGTLWTMAVLAAAAGWGVSHDTTLAPNALSLAQLRDWLGQ